MLFVGCHRLDIGMSSYLASRVMSQMMNRMPKSSPRIAPATFIISRGLKSVRLRQSFMHPPLRRKWCDGNYIRLAAREATSYTAGIVRRGSLDSFQQSYTLTL